MKLRDAFLNKVGKWRMSWPDTKKLSALVCTLVKTLLLYLTTEVEDDHSIIYENTCSLENGHKYWK